MRKTRGKKIDLYIEAWRLWGEDSQLDMLVEECAELIVATQHYRRGRKYLGDVLSELADVSIMIEQIRHMMFSQRQYRVTKEGKLLRLAGTIADYKDAQGEPRDQKPEATVL